MARTAPSGVIATIAPWLTPLLSPFCASSSVSAFSAPACRPLSIVVRTTMSSSTWPSTSLIASMTQSAT